MCASHNGEDIHVKTAQNMAKKLKLKETDYECGLTIKVAIHANEIDQDIFELDQSKSKPVNWQPNWKDLEKRKVG